MWNDRDRIPFGFWQIDPFAFKEFLPANTSITQTWTRSAISNNLETADIAVKSKGIISDKTIVKNHPWVSNPEEELKDIEEQEVAAIDFQDQIPINSGGGNARAE